MPEAKKLPEKQSDKKPAPKKPGPYAPFESLGEFTNDRVLCNARLSPCGKYVVAGGTTGLVHRWELIDAEAAGVAEFKPLADLPGHGGWVQCVTFAPQGGRVFTADSWGKLAAWDFAAAGTNPVWELPEAHAAWIRNLAVSPDGKLLATAGRDGLVKLWDAASGKLRGELADHHEDVYSVAFSPNGAMLASGDFLGKIKLWNVAEQTCVADLDGSIFSEVLRLQDCGGVRILLFDGDGKRLVAAGAEPTGGGTFQGYPTIVTYDVAPGSKTFGQATKTYKLGETKDGFVTDVAWRSEEEWVVVTSGVTGNGKLILLKSTDDKPHVETTKLQNIHSLSMHPDGRRFLVTTCNSRNSGNGAVKNKETMEYAGNWSPVKLLELPSTTAS